MSQFGHFTGYILSGLFGAVNKAIRSLGAVLLLEMGQEFAILGPGEALRVLLAQFPLQLHTVDGLLHGHCYAATARA